jgi:hypothetical protein
MFWDITLWSSLKVNRCFGEICRLHLQGRRVSQARTHRENRWQADPSVKADGRRSPGCFLAWLIPRSRRWRRHILPERRLTFNGLYGVISQDIELFKFQEMLLCLACLEYPASRSVYVLLTLFKNSISLTCSISNHKICIALSNFHVAVARKWISCFIKRFVILNRQVSNLKSFHVSPLYVSCGHHVPDVLSFEFPLYF